MQAIDLRDSSSDWRMSCPVHGEILMALQFGGDWSRTFCQDCFEASVANVAKLVTVSASPGAPSPEVAD
jgi:hypothetical protein